MYGSFRLLDTNETVVITYIIIIISFNIQKKNKKIGSFLPFWLKNAPQNETIPTKRK